jgi:5-methylcytosine-specific restriction endonuclease McrA
MVMSNYKFKREERFAVFTIHGQSCYVCGDPLTMKTVEVDHVVPERLANDPNEFAEARSTLGLDPDFNLNSYENWLPACRLCNGRKGSRVWSPSLLSRNFKGRGIARSKPER